MAKKTKVDIVENKSTKNKGGYGVLSLMAMIIGIVIGSGIFAKNAGLISTAGSTSMVALTWIIGAIVVITIVIAFLEIISITEIADEQSTTANWGRKLLGIRFGRFVGYYITLVYFPIIIAALFQFASSSFLESISYGIDGFDYATLEGDPVKFTGAIIVVSIIFLFIIMLINAVSTKPGKYFQNIGTMIKTIPLFFVIAVFIYMIASNTGDIHFATAEDLGNTAPTSTMETLGLVLATIPAVLFAFDGFLLAGALSKEAKKPSSFKVAFILSMIFIILIYLTFSVAVLGLGDFSEGATGSYGSITNAIYATFDPKYADILSPVINGIITISMLTGVSGCSIAAYRSLSDLSVHNTVRDPKLKYVKKNRFGISVGSGMSIIGITLFWYLLSIGCDTYLAIETGNALVIADFSSNLIIVLAYFIYAAIIFGAIINRFKKKANRVPVKKNLLFLPAALIAVVSTTIITAYFGYAILFPPSTGIDLIYGVKLLYTLVFFVTIIFICVWNSGRTADLDESLVIDTEFLAKKAEAVALYYGDQAKEVTTTQTGVKMVPESLVRERLTTIESKLEEYVMKSEEKHAKEIAELKAQLEQKAGKASKKSKAKK